MPVSRRARYGLLLLTLYLTLCTIGGIYLADGTLHPARRPLTVDEVIAAAFHANLSDASISTPDGATLRAWLFIPSKLNGDAVLLLHGLGDNRVGMTGYAQLLLAHGFIVLVPDARAHGTSGGPLATYGLLERNDIHQWADFLADLGLTVPDHRRCIFALGESMGAAQLLQSLDTHPGFCAVVAESSFSAFREIAYDRMGQPFHVGPWVGRTILRPLVEVAFLRARLKYHLRMDDISPEDSVAATNIPVLLIHGAVDSNIPARHSERIHARAPNTTLWEVPEADHCGALSTSPNEFEHRLLAWFGEK